MPFLKASKELDSPDDQTGQLGVNYRPEYNADASEGMPCGIQLMGRPMHDEELFRNLEVVDAILKTVA